MIPDAAAAELHRNDDVQEDTGNGTTTTTRCRNPKSVRVCVQLFAVKHVSLWSR